MLTPETVRPATAGDAPLLATLHAPSFPEEPWPADAFAALLDSPGVFGLIGFADSSPDRPDRARGFIVCRMAADEGEILTLAVLPGHRRAGLGGRLLAGALARSAAWGTGTFFLEVAEDNPAALALYRGAGFEPVGRRPGYYRRDTGRVAALVLARRLADLLTPSPP